MKNLTMLKEKLDRVLERFKRGERKGLVLTMLAASRLSDKREEISPDNIVKEAQKIMDEAPDIDWGVTREEYTIGLASSLLQELVEMGVLEETDTTIYRFKRYSEGDPKAEILARFGYLIFYGGPAR